jgi:hypothetical protein
MRTFTKSPLFYLVSRIKGHRIGLDGLTWSATGLVAPKASFFSLPFVARRTKRHEMSPDDLLFRATRMVPSELAARDAGDVRGVGACRPGTSATREVVTWDIRGIKGLKRVLQGAGLAVSVLVIFAPSASAATSCPNEQLRQESNTNPHTGQPYDDGLPECRAYEMVSPLEKQGQDALTPGAPTIFVSSEGNGVQWISEGAYAGADNYQVGSSVPTNPYVAGRTATGWVTRSAYPPSDLIEVPAPAYTGSGVFSPDLEDESVCGSEHAEGTALRCALREPSGAWIATGAFSTVAGSEINVITNGASRDGDVYVFQSVPGQHLAQADDTSATSPCRGEGQCGGIYEVTGIGTQSPTLQMIDVNNNGEMIGPESPASIGALPLATPFGGSYQAISADGTKVFFTATPPAGVPTLYARVNGTETVSISEPLPSECTICGASPGEGRFQGASASGEKVFFTTKQQLLNSDTDTTNDLYEYDFAEPATHKLIQVSAGGLGDVTPGSGAQVQGVVSVSEDGTHVYFVAQGVLTSLPNGLGQTASNDADNLYAYDTATDETKFVATLSSSDKQLWGEPVASGTAGSFDAHTAQATPDGRYLAFDSFAPLVTSGVEADTSREQQVYRYDFDTGQIVRVSVGHEGYANNGNVPDRDAVIAPTGVRLDGAAPAINESNRAISENGESIAFVTAAQLQGTDHAGGSAESCADGTEVATGPGCEVYLWHECANGVCPDGDSGEVNMISDGESAAGLIYAGMSSTASDVFFQTRTQLVGQDTDSLGDIYDARIDGGFPAAAPEPSCSGEQCQGIPSASPAGLKPEGSSITAGGGNLNATPFVESPEPKQNPKPKSKPLTSAQKLAKALKRCENNKAKTKRQACEKAAHKRYAPKPKPKKKQK